MLEPNLVSPDPGCTTKPQKVQALAEIFINVANQESIGEGSAADEGFKFKSGIQYNSRKAEISKQSNVLIIYRLF